MALKWPWSRTEQRASSYDSLVSEAIIRAATGGDVVSADGLAAAEQAAGLIGRCFASAEVEGDRYGLVTPGVLELIGRELVRRGQAVFSIEGGPGMLRLVPVGTFDIRGGNNPLTWYYRTDIFGASDHQTRLVPASGVVHARINVDPVRPWLGRSPLNIAASTSATAAKAERAATDELEFKPTRLLPVPGTPEQMTKLVRQLAKSGLVVTGSAAGLAAYQTGQEPSSRWAAQKIQPDPSTGHVSLRTDAAMDVLAACGIPATLMDPKAEGTSRREAYRQLLHSTVTPWANLVRAELRAKLDSPDLSLSFRSLFAGDIQTRTRGVKQLTDAGLTLNQALVIVGLSEDVT